MNKKLVALAVAGAFALPLAAEAQTAQVTLYGRANMDLEFVKGLGPWRLGWLDVDCNSRGQQLVALWPARHRGAGRRTDRIFPGRELGRLGRQPERNAASAAPTRSPIAKPSSACRAASARSGWAVRFRRTTTRRRSGLRVRTTTTPACSTTRACGRTTRMRPRRRSAATTTVTATASAGTARRGPASPRKCRSRPERTPVTAGRSCRVFSTTTARSKPRFT